MQSSDDRPLDPRLPLLALTLIVPALLFVVCWPYQVDDGYILARYARHLSEGAGLVWNVGQPPVEGYTNLLYVLLGAPLARADLNPVLLYKGLGVLGWVACVVLTVDLGRRVWGLTAALLGVVPLLCSPGFVFWASAGLETTVFAALLLGALSAFERDTVRADVLAATLLLVAALTRTEGPVFALALALARAWLEWRRGTRGEALARRAGPWVLVFALPWLVYFFARAAWFGHWLSTPVLFKSTFSAGDQGQSVLIDFVHAWWPWLAVAGVGLWRARGRGASLVAVLALGALTYASASSTSHGSTTMSFYDRFLLPLAPVLAVANGGALVALWRVRRWAGALAVTALSLWTSFNPYVNTRIVDTLVRSQVQNVAPAVLNLTSFLVTQRPRGYHVALGDVGYLGWRLHGVIDDLYGLNDYEYALVSKGQLDDWAPRVLARDPDGFVFVMAPGDHGLEAAHVAEQAVLALPAFAQRYTKVREFTAGDNPWRYVLFERRAPAP
jgi:hypothetical protein